MIFGHLLLEKDVPEEDEDYKLEEDDQDEEEEEPAEEVEDEEEDDNYSLPDDEEEDETETKEVPSDGDEDYSLPEDTEEPEENPTPEENEVPTDDNDYSLDNEEEPTENETEDNEEEPTEDETEEEPTEDETEEEPTEDETGDEETEDSNVLNSDKLKELEQELYKNMTPAQLNTKNKELKKNFYDLYNNIEVILTRVEEINKTTSNIYLINFIKNKLEETKDYVYNYLSDTYHTNTYLENNKQYLIFVSILNNINLLFIKMNTKKDN